MLAAGYVLGDLSPSESIEFESLLSQNPTLQAEVNALEMAFNQLPQSLSPITPPPALKGKIMAATERQFQSNPGFNQTVEPGSNRSDCASTPEEVLDRQPKFPWGKVMAAVGTVVGGFLLFDNFRLRQELQFARQVNQPELAQILQQPKSRLVALNTQDSQPVGNILFVPGKWQQVIVSARNLPPLPVDRVYRMWLELQNGQIIPCGEFKTDDRGSVFTELRAKQNPPSGVKAKGVFITIERPQDPLQPTGKREIVGTI